MISDTAFGYFDKLEDELIAAGLTQEAKRLKELRIAVQNKRDNRQLTHLKCYLNSFDSIPFFDESMWLIEPKPNETISLDKKRYVIREIEDFSHLGRKLVRMLVTKEA